MRGFKDSSLKIRMDCKSEKKGELKCLMISLLIHALFFLFYFNGITSYKTKELKETSVQVSLTDRGGTGEGDTENIKKEEQQKLPEVSKQEVKKVEKQKENNLEKEIKKPIKEENVVKAEPTKSTNITEKVEAKEPNNTESNAESGIAKASNSNNDGNSSNSQGIDENITVDGSGGKIGKNQNIDGIKYKILKSKDPEYPSLAKKFKITEKVVVKAKFLVGLNGDVEKIEILEGPDKFGFKNAVRGSLEEWKFTPVEYKGEIIKLYFYKEFVFKIE